MTVSKYETESACTPVDLGAGYVHGRVDYRLTEMNGEPFGDRGCQEQKPQMGSTREQEAAMTGRRLPSDNDDESSHLDDSERSTDCLKMTSSIDSTVVTNETSLQSSLDVESKVEVMLTPDEESPLRHRRPELSSSHDNDEEENVDDQSESKKRRFLVNKERWNGRTARNMLMGWLALVVFFYMIVRMEKPRPWNYMSRRKIRKMMRKLQSTNVKSEVSVVLKGSRVDLLLSSLQHHARCPMIRSMHIQWTDEGEIPLRLSRNEHVAPDSEAPATDAVLLLDEGILFSCREIERALNEWHHDRAHLVGLLPPASHGLVSDSAAIVHRLLLPVLPDLGQHDPCQPLARSAQLATLTLGSSRSIVTHPVWLVHPPGANEQCLSRLSKLFGFSAQPDDKTKNYTGHS